jgi:phosphohistidine phosphatase
MKNLLIMRHAKSDWSTGDKDFDRPLNKRGKRDAPFMGEQLKMQEKIPDLILSSPARRAEMTTNAVVENSGYNGQVIWNDDIYYEDERAVIEYIKTISSDIGRVMLVGHNPTLEYLLTMLTLNNEAMPTASIASVLFNIDSWADIKMYEAKLEWLIKPKELRKK